MYATPATASLNLDKLFTEDPLLKQFEAEITRRHNHMQYLLNEMVTKYKSINNFTKAYTEFGLHYEHFSLKSTEWIPNAKSVSLVGDFNNWNGEKFQYKDIESDIWEIEISKFDINKWNKTPIKLEIITKDNRILRRISPWAKYLLFNKEKSVLESVIYYEKDFVFKYPRPNTPESLKIYEAHIGISSEREEIATYQHFKDSVIPRIKDLGYNALQLMGIMEHALYSSFGYQVTNFFACSSRFGTPLDLKELIDEAHRQGILVFLDIVHSHASQNSEDGLNYFDGTDEMFFLPGLFGRHVMWGTRLFNYSKLEVLQFLVSNARYWIEEFCFDGLRFDGVTSMLYHHHGINVSFTGQYGQYFDYSVNRDGVLYLKLVNYLLTSQFPFITLICEDVSGMPTLCRPISEGGFGFHFRLGMGIPDLWTKLVKIPDCEWSMDLIVSSLCNRRDDEQTIAYSECHDQSIVGDKTIAFWLMDRNMYMHMSINSPSDAVIDRGIALHKMIRLITNALGGNAYLNFMGNEFGHPEWLDFPREGNKFSCHYARRQWNLADDENLKYKFLYRFDKKMNELEIEHKWLSRKKGHVFFRSNDEKIITFIRGNCVFLFNFHSDKSYFGFEAGVSTAGKYRCVLNSDNEFFGGFNRIDESVEYFTQPENRHGENQYLSLYLPSRTAVVCCPI